jgi:hypothetical protein
MDNKKILVEENRGNEFRRILMEQGFNEEAENPDYVHELKQGLAKNSMIFINGFFRAVIPAIIIGLIVIGYVIYMIVK